MAPTLVAKQDNSPEDYAKEMEKQVNGLIEVSADKVRGCLSVCVRARVLFAGSFFCLVCLCVMSTQPVRITYLSPLDARGRACGCVCVAQCMKGDFSGSLDEAKEAAKRERSLCKYRESNGLVDQINIDLTYAVCFNLANAYHKVGHQLKHARTRSLMTEREYCPLIWFYLFIPPLTHLLTHVRPMPRTRCTRKRCTPTTSS